MNLVNGNSSMTDKLVKLTSSKTSALLGSNVLEEVVETEGQIVMGGGGVEGGQQNVVMVTDGALGTHQIVITDGLDVGTQVIQLDDGNLVMGTRRLKDLTSLREEDEVISLDQPHNSIQDDLGALVVEMASPPKRSKPTEVMVVSTASSVPSNTSNNTNSHPGKTSIAKQFTPFGFHCTLEAPTAQWVRKDEDRCTYMNKGQFYGITLEYRNNPTEPVQGDLSNVRSIVMLVFRDAKNTEDEINAWEFWQSRQPNNKQRIIDVETNNLSDCGISEIRDMSHNAVAIFWNPLENPAFLSIAIQCLSTDFSLQKGVKGLPMHLQIDTYVKNCSDGEYDIVNRSYCQVKVFCDKGAERKCRQEERRAARKVNVGGTRVLEMYHQSQERSEFYSMVDLSKIPVLYTPSAESSNSLASILTSNITAPLNILKSTSSVSSGSGSGETEPPRRRKAFPPPETRMVVYVRQENEEIYTPLHLVPPTVPGLAKAIETKYNVSATAIRYLYRRNSKGIVAKLDDDLLKFYCNEDTFLMQVTAIELEGAGGQDSIMYDITLCELNET